VVLLRVRFHQPAWFTFTIRASSGIAEPGFVTTHWKHRAGVVVRWLFATITQPGAVTIVVARARRVTSSVTSSIIEQSRAGVIVRCITAPGSVITGWHRQRYN